MAKFWQRAKDQLTAPAKYIQTTDTVSRPMAVMMSLVMLLIVIAVILGIFFAGKWSYSQIANKSTKPNKPAAVVSVKEPAKPAKSSESQNTQATNSSVGTNANSPATDTAQQSTTSSAVPNTGPQNLVILFVLSTFMGALIYRLFLLKRLK